MGKERESVPGKLMIDLLCYQWISLAFDREK